MKTNSTISQEQLEAIERYINGTMSQEELKAFKTQLENDSEFKTQVEDIRILLSGIEEQSLKAQLDEFHNDIIKQPSQEDSPKVRYLQFRKLVAAAAIIIALGSFWFYNQNSTDRLYSKYFVPDPGLPTTMSHSSNFEFYDAMVNYKQGDYKIAIEKWEVLKEKTPSNDTLNYFLGVAYLANKSETNAIPFLEKSIQDKDFPLANDAYYYLGLAYLKEGNIKKAKENFQKSNIENSNILLSKLND
ncbi:tetratricopeptide repeat protein [Psychroserpens mesophilus]|uniref:tetratricopeptide repeat protein n=1 Tax=Psychroserpens mesophilus TaxID=325473 RepID=UPI003D64959D